MGYTLDRDAIKFVGSLIAVAFSSLTSGTVQTLAVLLIVLMSLDYLSGLSVAVTQRKVSSRVSLIGLIRKVQVLVLVMGVAAVESAVSRLSTGTSFSTTLTFGDVEIVVSATAGVIAWFVLHEAISVTENVARTGVPLPPIVRRALSIAEDALNADAKK